VSYDRFETVDAVSGQSRRPIASRNVGRGRPTTCPDRVQSPPFRLIRTKYMKITGRRNITVAWHVQTSSTRSDFLGAGQSIT